MEMPTTLLEAIRYFSDEQTCINAVAYLRWEDGSPVCPKCNAAQGERNHYWLAKQRRWKCYACGKQFSVKVGTIFEDSPIPLTKWLPAMWLLVNCKNGVSSYEVSRDLGISPSALSRIDPGMLSKIDPPAM
jgi:transposase-like protein